MESHDDDRRHGPQTLLALRNFPVRGRRFGDVPEMVRAYAYVKAAAATTNVELGVLPADIGGAIVRSALSVAQGAHADAFPTALLQGGGGTSTNMNVNEVLARLATGYLSGTSGQRVHPNDHVNRSQSTNDTYPTAMAIAVDDLSTPTVNALKSLEAQLLEQGERHRSVQRLGRTCLQDAVPLTVGETHRAQAGAVARGRLEITGAVAALSSVPLGATAVGTSIGAPAGYADRAVSHLNDFAGTTLSVASDYFDALAHLDPYSTVAGAIARTAVTLDRIARDLRLLSSGPIGGIGEVTLPALQAGSSIMPGKINPVIPELVMQLGHRIRGRALSVDLAVAAGELELNVMEPVIVDSLVDMLQDLEDAATALGGLCISGLTWNLERIRANLAGSLADQVISATQHGYSAVVGRDASAARTAPTGE